MPLRGIPLRSGVKNYVRLSVFHLSSRPKWRDPSCRALNREREKGEKGSTKVSFACGRMRAYGGSAIKIKGCARDDDTGEGIGHRRYEREREV